MTPEPAAVEAAHEVVSQYWSVDYDDGLVAAIAQAMATYAAAQRQAVERERDYWKREQEYMFKRAGEFAEEAHKLEAHLTASEAAREQAMRVLESAHTWNCMCNWRGVGGAPRDHMDPACVSLRTLTPGAAAPNA